MRVDRQGYARSNDNLPQLDNLRITPRLARAAVEGCMRCLDTTEVAPGAWYAADPDGGAVCDTCAGRDDPQGYAQLTGWRRAARPTRRSEPA